MESTPPKTNECPLKSDYFSREYIFQPSIFKGHVSFQGGNPVSPMTQPIWRHKPHDSTHFIMAKLYEKNAYSRFLWNKEVPSISLPQKSTKKIWVCFLKLVFSVAINLAKISWLNPVGRFNSLWGAKDFCFSAHDSLPGCRGLLQGDISTTTPNGSQTSVSRHNEHVLVVT